MERLSRFSVIQIMHDPDPLRCMISRFEEEGLYHGAEASQDVRDKLLAAMKGLERAVNEVRPMWSLMEDYDRSHSEDDLIECARIVRKHQAMEEESE